MIMSQDKKFLVWSNNDPNDSFEVYAPNVDAAAWAALQDLGLIAVVVGGEPNVDAVAWAALQDLGWCVSDTFIEDTPSDNDDATGNNK